MHLSTLKMSNCNSHWQMILLKLFGGWLVIHVVIDNASAYKAMRTMLMEKRKKLYWTYYIAYCIDLMLEKLGEVPQHKNALIKAKRVSNLIYKYFWVLGWMRKYINKKLSDRLSQDLPLFIWLYKALWSKEPIGSNVHS